MTNATKNKVWGNRKICPMCNGNGGRFDLENMYMWPHCNHCDSVGYVGSYSRGTTDVYLNEADYIDRVAKKAYQESLGKPRDIRKYLKRG